MIIPFDLLVFVGWNSEYKVFIRERRSPSMTLSFSEFSIDYLFIVPKLTVKLNENLSEFANDVIKYANASKRLRHLIYNNFSTNEGRGTFRFGFVSNVIMCRFFFILLKRASVEAKWQQIVSHNEWHNTNEKICTKVNNKIMNVIWTNAFIDCYAEMPIRHICSFFYRRSCQFHFLCN